MTSAQDIFTEGFIVSKRRKFSDNKQLNESLETKTYFKDNKSRAERYNPMSGSRFSITDYETKNTLVLIDNPMLGKEYELKKESSFKEVLKDAEVEEGGKTNFFF